MARKVKGPCGDDIHRRRNELDFREVTVKRETLTPPSSITLFYDCPFCQQEVKAFYWSLCGSGKRCNCGALVYGRRLTAIHFKSTTEKGKT